MDSPKEEEVAPLLIDAESNIYRSQIKSWSLEQGQKARKTSTGSSFKKSNLCCLGCLSFVLLLFIGLLIFIFFINGTFRAYSDIVSLVHWQWSWLPWLPSPLLILVAVLTLCFFVACCGCLPVVDKNAIGNRQIAYAGFTCFCSSCLFLVVTLGVLVFFLSYPSAARTANEICRIYDSPAGIAACKKAVVQKVVQKVVQARVVEAPASPILLSKAAAQDRLLNVNHQSEFVVGDWILIGKGTPKAEVNQVTAFGTMYLKDPLQYDHGYGVIVERISQPPTHPLPIQAPPPTNPPPSPPPRTSVWIGEVQPVNQLIAAPTAERETTKPPLWSGPMPAQQGGTVLIETTAGPSRRVASVSSDVDLDELEDSEAPWRANFAAPTLRRLDAAHNATKKFWSVQDTSLDAAFAQADENISDTSTGVSARAEVSTGAFPKGNPSGLARLTDPVAGSCDAARVLCVPSDTWNYQTSCACNGEGLTLNGELSGGYCSPWNNVVDDWCFVNPGVQTCSAVTKYNGLYRSSGPCTDLVVSRSKVFVEGLFLFQIAIVVGCLLSFLACCSCCLMLAVVAPRRKTAGNAVLTAAVRKGEKVLQVSQQDGFRAGQSVVIDEGTAYEEVCDIKMMGSLILSRPCVFAHAIGAPVAVTSPAMVSMGLAPTMFEDQLNSNWCLEDQFRWAQKMGSSKLAENTPEEMKLELYGYFHQAVDGNVSGSRPSVFNIDDMHRWDAHKRVEGLPRNEAMRLYIDSVQSLLH